VGKKTRKRGKKRSRAGEGYAHTKGRNGRVRVVHKHLVLFLTCVKCKFLLLIYYYLEQCHCMLIPAQVLNVLWIF
jgi:hypothetical protein